MCLLQREETQRTVALHNTASCVGTGEDATWASRGIKASDLDNVLEKSFLLDHHSAKRRTD